MRSLYGFGPFVADELKRVLLRDGHAVPLTPKAFETLLLLIHNRERVMEKDELMAELWPDTVVEENTLARNISMLRKALGETHDERSYIVTIPGRGYCFVAEVRNVSIEHEQQATQTRSESELGGTVPAGPGPEIKTSLPGFTESDKRIGRQRNVLLVLATVVILVLGVRLGLSGRASRRSTALFQTIELKKLTGTGNILDAAISPDGKYVAYIQTDAGKQSLRLRQTLGDSDPVIIPPSEASYARLIFSPDGSSLYFVMADGKDNSNTLYQLPMLGGVARKIIARVNSAVTFSPDGGRLAFVRNYPEQQESALMTANVDGTAEQRLAVRQNPDSLLIWLSGPAWSPDGKLIVVPVLIKDGGMHCELIEVQVSGGTQRTITGQRWGYIGRLSWLPNGNGLIMTAAEADALNPQVWYLSWPDGVARRVSQDLAKYYGLSLTADAGAFTTVQFEELTSIWAAPSAEPGRAVKVTSGSNDTFAGLAWTQDGELVFASNLSGVGHLWTAEMDGSRQQLLFSEATNRSPVASPDGRYIVFSSNRNGQINIWRVDRDGRNPVQLTNGNYDYEPRCSPDGKWVVYMARGGAPSSALLKVSIDGGAPVQLAEKIVGLAGISSDGKWIAYNIQSYPWKVAVTPLEGGTPTRVFENVDSSVRWAPDGRALTWVKTSGGVSNIWRQPLDGGPAKQLTSFTADQITDFAWSRDGRELAFRRHVTTSNVILVSNVR
jgi:eukaryotic-like serine/threonine-protein kinase